MDANRANSSAQRRIATALLAIGLVAAALPAGLGGVVAADAVASQQGGPTVAISELQSNTTVDGASAYEGRTVTVSGTVTAVSPDGFFVQNASAPDARYSGIYAYTGGSSDVSVGDTVEITAPLKEYYGLTELDLTAGSASTTATGTGPVPDAVSVSTGAASQEAYESVLVNVTGLTVTSTPGQHGEWAVTDGSAPLAVDDADTGDSAGPSENGSTVEAIEGPVYYSFGAFKIQPRSITGLAPPTAGNATNGTEITLLGYNDIGKAAAGSGEDDLGRMITLIDEQRAESDGPVFVAGGGDEVSPHALRNYAGLEYGYEPPVTALNILDPDAEVVQNHELDYDEDAGTNDFAIFENISRESTYPWLLANVVRESDGSNLPGTRNYTVVERGGVRVGFFGVTDEAINAKTDGVVARNGYEVLDPTSTAQRVTDTLREEEDVDVVVALAPLGIPDSKALARNVDGIDALISGDDQRRYPPQPTDGVLIAETSGRANAIAKMSLTVENGSVTAASGTLVDVTTNTPRNETWKAYINPLREQYLNTPVVRAEMPEHTGVGSDYTDDTATGALLMDGIRNVTGADVSLTNAGGIRDTLYPDTYAAGEEFEITRGMVTSTLSFGNRIVVLEVTGAELRAILRSQIAPLGADNQYGTQIQQQVGGVTFEWVPHTDASPPGEGDGVIQDLIVDGDPVEENATYTLATNSYIADGGSGYPLADEPRVTVYNDTTMAQGVLAYLQTRERIDAEEVDTRIEDRMRRVDLTLESSAVTASEADGNTTLSIDVPARVEGVAGEAVLSDRRGTRLAIADVGFDAAAGTVTATVPTADLDRFGVDPFVNGSGVDLYVPYTDTEYTSRYENFDAPILNVDFGPASADERDARPGSTVQVGSATLDRGETATVPVTLAAAPNGFAGGKLTVAVSNTEVARITNASYPADVLSREPELTADGAAVTLALADVEKVIQAGATDATLAEVTLGSAGTGTATLNVTVDRFDGENGTAMTVETRDGTVTAGPPAVGGSRPADLDGDGTFEDLNANGRLDYDDVAILFENFDRDQVRSNGAAYDFNGNGQLDYDDVVTLYQRVD